MKYRIMEIGMVIIGFLPFVMVTKSGQSVSVDINYSRVAEVLLISAIIGLVGGYIVTNQITTKLTAEMGFVKTGLSKIEKRIDSFHK